MSAEELSKRKNHLKNRRKLSGAIATFISHSGKSVEKLKEQLAVTEALVTQKRKEFQNLIYSNSSEEAKK